MCWSYEVALGFAVAELVVLSYVVARNLCFDRANAIFHLPLVVQELLQAALWPHVGESGLACDAANRALSYAVTLVVLGLPPYSALVAKASQSALEAVHVRAARPLLAAGLCAKSHKLEVFETQLPRFSCSICAEENVPLGAQMWGCRRCNFDACQACFEAAGNGGGSEAQAPPPPAWAGFLLGKQPALWAPRIPASLKKRTKYLASFTLWFWLFCLFIMWRRIYGVWPEGSFYEGPRCTTRGPYGHQVWPMMVWGDRWCLRLFFAMCYFSFGGGFNLMPRPSYLIVAMNLLTAFAWGCYVAIGEEWGSVWCWAASCFCALYVVEPLLFQRYRVFDEEDAEAPDDPCVVARRQRFGYWGARIHYADEIQPVGALDMVLPPPYWSRVPAGYKPGLLPAEAAAAKA